MTLVKGSFKPQRGIGGQAFFSLPFLVPLFGNQRAWMQAPAVKTFHPLRALERDPTLLPCADSSLQSPTMFVCNA